MARLIIKSLSEFKLWQEDDKLSEIPYYKVFVTVEGKSESIDGELVFNFEDNILDFRWMNPQELEELDYLWNGRIVDQVEGYLKKKVDLNAVKERSKSEGSN